MPIYPQTFPHDLEKKPRLVGESLVYAALQAALSDAWSIFYDWPVPGTRRRVDFLCIDSGRGVAAFEVKGGMVHKHRRTFVQKIRKDGIRKKIMPFGQLRIGIQEVMTSCGIDPAPLKIHESIFFPQMSKSAYTFGEGPHFFTSEDLDPVRLWTKLAPHLPPLIDAAAQESLQRFIDAMRRNRRGYKQRGDNVGIAHDTQR